jgi:hypothetical protein
MINIALVRILSEFFFLVQSQHQFQNKRPYRIEAGNEKNTPGSFIPVCVDIYGEQYGVCDKGEAYNACNQRSLNSKHSKKFLYAVSRIEFPEIINQHAEEWRYHAENKS